MEQKLYGKNNFIRQEVIEILKDENKKEIFEKFVFFLCHYKGYKAKEIAIALSISKKKINKMIMKFDKLKEKEIIFFEKLYNKTIEE
jgi:hypothetical protein